MPYNPDDKEEKLKVARGAVQRRFDEICRFIVDGDNNLTQLMVRAHRAGLPAEKSQEIFRALRDCATDAESTFAAAIAQPAPKVGGKQRVVL